MRLTRDTTIIGLLTLALAGVACGGDDETGSGGSGSGAGKPGCGTQSDPALITLSDVSPAAGSTVSASGVVHRFTTTNVAGYVDMFTFAVGAGNTAGVPTQGGFSFTIMDNQDGTFTYEAAPVDFPMAGNVELSVQERELYQRIGGLFVEEALPAGHGVR